MEDSIRIKDERSIPARRFRINDRPVLWMAPVRGDTVVEGLSLDWSGLRPSDEAAVLDRVARARNHGEASDALRDWTVSTGVWFFADRTGEVAYKTAGSVCKPSGDGRREWIRFASAPLETPDHRNLLAGTGEWITDGKTSLPLTAQAQSDFRMIRLQALLSTKDTLSPADLKSIQADEVSMDAQRMLLILLSPLSRTSWTDPMERKGVELLKAWDGRMNPGSAGAALVEILFQRLSENRFLRAFGEPLYSLFAGYPNLAMQALHETWSNAAANRPSLDTLAVMSFRETIAAIRNLCGEDPAEWTWGAVHTVTFEHPLRSNTLLDKAGMAAAGPFPVGGSSSTLSFWEHPLQIPFTVKGCASARLLWDVGNLNNSIAVIPAGQSGQPMNNHYKDQLPLYLDQCFRPELWDDTKVLNAGWECLSFIPVQAAQ
jgi:penicillin amidase